jgi:hypothetical protein
MLKSETLARDVSYAGVSDAPPANAALDEMSLHVGVERLP